MGKPSAPSLNFTARQRPSLRSHGKAQALFWRDEMLKPDGIRADIDLNPIHIPAERFARRIIEGHR